MQNFKSDKADITEGTQAAQELLDRKAALNKRGMIGGALTTVGDTTTLTTGILTLSGVGAIVAPLSIFSSMLSISGNTLSFMSKGKADTLAGKTASESARKELISTAAISTSASSAPQSIQNSVTRMNNYQMKVAESKLHSLMNQVLKEARKGKIKSDPAFLHQEVERRAGQLVGRFSRDTSLLDSDLNKMKNLLATEYSVKFFDAGGLEKLQSSLSTKLKENMDSLGLEPSDSTLKKIHKGMTDKLYLYRRNDNINKVLLTETGKFKKLLTADEIKSLCDNDPGLQELYDRIFAEHVIPQIKTDTKFLRNHATESFLNSVQAGAMAEKTVQPEANTAGSSPAKTTP